jgi:hypothetical protein
MEPLVVVAAGCGVLEKTEERFHVLLDLLCLLVLSNDAGVLDASVNAR